MNNESVALLVTGQMRAMHPFAENMKRLSPLAPCVIVSVWSARGTKKMGWLGPPQIERVLGPEIAAAFPPELCGEGPLKEFLPEFFASLPDWSESVEASEFAELNATEIDIEGVSEFTPHKFPGMAIEYIFHKLDRATNLMYEIEAERGRRFDFVIRMRPDLLAPRTIDITGDPFLSEWIPDGGRELLGDNFIGCR